MKKVCFVLNLLFLLITCAWFYVFMIMYNGLVGPDANVGTVLLSAIMIHIPFIAVVGGSVATWIFAAPALKIQNGFVRFIVISTIIISIILIAITGFLYFMAF